MFPPWVNDYIGIPFEQCDCWQLVCRVYREQLAIRLPDLNGRYDDSQDREAIRELYQTELPRVWQRVDKPDIFTAVVFKIQGQLWHVGIVIGDNFMLHTHDKIDAAVERYTNSIWGHRIEGFYNYVG